VILASVPLGQQTRVGILGGRGFVGSAFVRACESRGLTPVIIGRAEYEANVGTTFDLLINANGNSSKIFALRQPLDDFDASVRSVRRSLLDFEIGLYVHLSSCDVYADCSSPATTREELAGDPPPQSTYGLHKWLAEECVRRAASRWLIFRLGGMVGPGLRKNAIFDILNGGPVWLDPQSRLQFMSTDVVAATVLEVVDRRVQGHTFNLCGEGTVRIADVIKWSGQEIAVSPGAPVVTYDVATDSIRGVTPVPGSEDAVRAFMGLPAVVRG
jgi:nucleoside-diphosphate-sugar epimerase